MSHRKTEGLESYCCSIVPHVSGEGCSILCQLSSSASSSSSSSSACASFSTASSGWQCSPPDLNRKFRLAVFRTGPQPRVLAGSVPRRTTQSQAQPQTQSQTQPQTRSHNHNHKDTFIYSTQPWHATTTHNHSTQPQLQRTTRGPTSKVENHKTHDHGNMLLAMA